MREIDDVGNLRFSTHICVGITEESAQINNSATIQQEDTTVTPQTSVPPPTITPSRDLPESSLSRHPMIQRHQQERQQLRQAQLREAHRIRVLLQQAQHDSAQMLLVEEQQVQWLQWGNIQTRQMAQRHQLQWRQVQYQQHRLRTLTSPPLPPWLSREWFRRRQSLYHTLAPEPELLLPHQAFVRQAVTSRLRPLSAAQPLEPLQEGQRASISSTPDSLPDLLQQRLPTSTIGLLTGSNPPMESLDRLQHMRRTPSPTLRDLGSDGQSLFSRRIQRQMQQHVSRSSPSSTPERSMQEEAGE